MADSNPQPNPRPAPQPAPSPAPTPAPRPAPSGQMLAIDAATLGEALHARRVPPMPTPGLFEAPPEGQVFIVNEGTENERRVDAWGNEVKSK